VRVAAVDVNLSRLLDTLSRAFKAIRRAEVVVLMLDASMGLVDQDRILAQRVADEGRACVIALNKWDAVPDKDEKTYTKGMGVRRRQCT
jgi:GTP-binding protein